MAIFHKATNTPPKPELIADWLPTQPWSPDNTEPLVVHGSFHFDDPEGQVGMQTYLVDAGETLLQIPLTYRNEPLDGGNLVGHLEHSVLGTRWVYDGLTDHRFLTLMAGVAMTGQGHALGMWEVDGRWQVVPEQISLVGGDLGDVGWTGGPVPLDQFVLHNQTDDVSSFRNDRFELSVFRKPATTQRRAMGLSGVWNGQAQPVLLAELRPRR